VLDRASSADVWVFIYANQPNMSKSALLSEYHGYAQLKAFRDGEIYGCDSGATPYFDEISFHPDYLLDDLIRLLHPDIASAESLRYYKKVSAE